MEPTSTIAADLEALEGELRAKIATTIHANLDLLRLSAAQYRSCEKDWLVRKLSDALGRVAGLTVSPEVPIVAGGRTKLVDLVLSRADVRLLLEVKSFPTNYGLGGKPITQFRNSVIRDSMLTHGGSSGMARIVRQRRYETSDICA
ncbi:MAG: hypothetical protein U0893_10470 [Chloroflexota bacterium]